MEVLSLSIARSILKPMSRERFRMEAYGAQLDALHMVILTRHEHGFTEEVHQGNVHLYPTNSRTRLMMLIDAYRVGKRILHTGKDMVVSTQDPFMLGFVGYLLSKYGGVRFQVQVHGDFFGSPYSAKNCIHAYMRRILGGFLMKRAYRIRVVSERIKQSLHTFRLNDARVTVLPIRPELETFLATPHTVGEHNPFVFLALSRFAPEKNIPLIVKSFAAVHTKYPHTRLRLVGGGSEDTKIRACIDRYGLTERVNVVSWTEHPEKEMQDADVFLSASDHEAYGLTLVEALAVGLPIVTTDVGCVGDVVINDTHGIVVPVRDVVKFTHAMERMVTDSVLRTRCSREGISTAQVLASVSEEAYVRAWVASLV